MALISKVFFKDTSDYMEYSYNILPFACIVLICAVKYKQKMQWIFSLISLIALGIYGARGALLAFLLCGIFISIVDVYYSNSKQEFVNRIFHYFVYIALFYIGVVLFLPKLLDSNLVENSYILKRINLGILKESSGRSTIMQICFEAIKKMGLKINGLYYDRIILPNGQYSHNFILESMISLGWFLGSSFIIWIFWCLIKGYMKQEQDGRTVFIFIVFALFFRYILSGSIFSEGKFIIFMAALISLNKNYVIDESRLNLMK